MRRLSRWFMAALTGLAVLWILWAMLSPVLPPLGTAATISSLAFALVALHFLADAAERRGWIYYRNRQGSWDAVGAAMAEVQAIYRPGQQHVRRVKERRDVHREDDEGADGANH
jgi:hypothetical protein